MIRLFNSLSARMFLILSVLISILPFLNTRVIRMAGDEKVYISQAIEMQRAGHWFVQTLGGDPNYFKPPFHFLLIRLGMSAFGNSLLAGVWMNALFALLAALLLFNLGKKHWGEDKALLLGLMGGLNVGVFSHALASQMEVELFFFYTLVLYLADKTKIKFARTPSGTDIFKSDILLWLAVGALGWVKSPAHSVLAGSSVLIYWLWNGALLPRLKSFGFYLSALLGVLFCALPFLPILLNDYTNFRNTYMMRENITKGGNNRHWSYVVEPLLHFALPWTMIVLFAFFKFSKKHTNRLARLGLSLSLPTILFWMCWEYKGQNYNLPTLSALFVFALACFDKSIPRICFQITGAIGLLAVILAIALLFRFLPLPTWWDVSLYLLSLTFLLSFSAIFLMFSESKILTLGTVFFFLGIGFFVKPLGEREIIDIENFLQENPGIVLHYDDLDTSIWNEWGLLQLTTGHPIHGVHKPEQLNNVFAPNHAIILQNKEALARAQRELARFNELSSMSSKLQSEVIPWQRWLTKGKDPSGRNMFKEAWQSRDLTRLERRFYILHFLSL